MRHLPQEDHADLGTVDDDNTEDMRTAPVNPGVGAPGEGRRDQSVPNEQKGTHIMTQPTETAQTWRDLAEQLTAEQIRELEYLERQHAADVANHGETGCSADDYGDWLIVEAREYIATNERDAELSARIQPPTGATTSGWDSFNKKTGLLSRPIQWANYDAGATTVAIDGWQDETGGVEGPYLSVYGLEGDGRLSADDARRLAEALVIAAAGLDALIGAGE